MTLTEGMKIISHRTSEERPEFHIATCEVFIQATKRVEKMPLIFRFAADATGTPGVYAHVAQLNRIMGFKAGVINGWIRERAKDSRSVVTFPSPIIKGLLAEKRGGGTRAQGVSLEFVIAELSRVKDRDRNRVLSYLRRWLYVVQQGYLYPGSGHVGLPESVAQSPSSRRGRCRGRSRSARRGWSKKLPTHSRSSPGILLHWQSRHCKMRACRAT